MTSNRSTSHHDRLVKAVFSEPENAMAHLKGALPSELVASLNMAAIRLLPGSWVDETLNEHHSDLLFSIPFLCQDGARADSTDAMKDPPPDDPSPDAHDDPDSEPPDDPSSEPPDDPSSEPHGDPDSEPPDDPSSEPPGDPDSEPPDDPSSEPPDGPDSEPPDDLILEADRTQRPDEALVYVLFEHQSSVRAFMALKVLRYVTRILDQWSRDHQGKALPPVIPLVLYHGRARWSAPTELEDLFNLSGLGERARMALRPHLPKLRYLLDEVPSRPSEIHAPPGIVRLTLLALRFGRSRPPEVLIMEWMEDLDLELQRGETGLHHIRIIVQYLLLVNPKATPQVLSEALRPMGTQAQELPLTWGMRAIEQGRQEGRLEGRQEGLHEVARRALAKGMSVSEVAELTGLAIEDIQKLAH